MTDPADRFLEERLHALARGAAVPVVPPDADVRRGRRRLLRMRLAMAGATTGTLAVVLGITSLTAGAPKATELPPVTQPPGIPSATPHGSPSSDPTSRAGTGKHDRTTGSVDLAGQPDSEPTGSGTTGSPGSDDTLTPPGLTDPPTNAASGGTHTHAGGSTVGGGHHEAAGTPSPDPTETPTSTLTPSSDPSPTATDPTATSTSTPTGPPTSTPTVPPGTTKVRVPQVLRAYNKVLAEHLDPDRAHLQPYSRAVDTKSTRRSHGTLYALGSTFRWEDGRSLSGLDLTVASGWDQVVWSCGASYAAWSCHDGAVAGSEVAQHDGVLQVAVEHANGQVVVVTADPTYDAGQDGTGARTNAIDSSEADLVAAAADERLVLPGVAPTAPPVIDLDAFSAAGVAALVKTGESYRQTGVDRTPWLRGEWTGADGTVTSTLAWSAEPIYSHGPFTCLTSYRSCTQVVVDDQGTTVDVALLKAKAGGGRLVQYDGGAYAVRVYSSSRAFPKKRAYAFVTQPAWQVS